MILKKMLRISSRSHKIVVSSWQHHLSVQLRLLLQRHYSLILVQLLLNQPHILGSNSKRLFSWRRKFMVHQDLKSW